jgi:hypothetical protein
MMVENPNERLYEYISSSQKVLTDLAEVKYFYEQL